MPAGMDAWHPRKTVASDESCRQGIIPATPAAVTPITGTPQRVRDGRMPAGWP